MLTQCRSWLIPGLLVMCGAAPTWAQSNDTLTLKAESSLRFDNNLFRLPANTNTEALIGQPSAAERINISSLSLNFSTTLSLQKLELAVNLTNYRYQNFSYLSFVAHNYNAAWRWALTPQLHGNLESQRQQTLNNFADYRGFNVQNLRTNSNTRVDTAYQLDGTWGVLAGVSQSTQTNQQTLTAESDYSDKSTNLGLLYTLASGSALTYTHRNTSGSYPNNQLPSAGLYDDGFKQLDNELRLHWTVTGKSTADLSAARISRSHPHYPQRDYSGLNAGVNYNWSLTGKSALAASWVRELSSYQTNSSNYSQTDRVSLAPVWQLSPKAVVRLRYEVARSDYLGSPMGALGPQRSDSTSDASLSLIWQAHKHLTLSTSLENTSRNSNLAGLDYESKMATVSAQFSY
ncbi:MAG: putative exosortase B-associated extracellular polysaccharide biosynthesis transporter EpsL [Rhodoferax sp.]|uniref:XrtB/PEP-CTERM-associated polysaccharide biosynthesis outer membrane protein EpsL n=1 Tax=Rhodoferax sp. TaxID=50421 RepID=UPI00261C4B7D|nr:XrtB/PEP-CTERM-associated polysaccharide biosynthesis outer membrane protein EpsL [Rhodoferax sp.]MDD5332964.1 putative exosortase B-associated extracellular polysaccharide biosynthesis transporter EpsL [Rhodoferax sp.]